METAHASPATLLAGSETAFVALLAAATHPDRFEGLILWGPSPC
jgi:pimeloyl-ACP methyl ester carboxylesterase